MTQITNVIMHTFAERRFFISRRELRATLGIAVCAVASWMMLVCALLACIATGAPAVASAAEETHVFNPTLSLTGNCATSPSDPVADPGLCPMPPGVPGVNHPAQPFEGWVSVGVDRFGDRYVAVEGATERAGEGRIDIFGPEGNFITEFAVPGIVFQSIAVDAQGNLYIVLRDKLYLYEPSAYHPATGEIEYNNPRKEVGKSELSEPYLSVNPLNGHIFSATGQREFTEWGSAAEGNPVITNHIGEGSVFHPQASAVDASRGRLYVATWKADQTSGDPEYVKPTIRIFELAPPHALLGSFDGSTTPAGKFLTEVGFFPLAVDEETGHVFLGELSNTARKKVLELDENGEYISTIEKPTFQANANNPTIAIDNGPTSPARGTLFVPSGSSPPVHLFAFSPKAVPKKPVIGSVLVSGISEDEAVVHAKVNPEGSETTYRIEYITQQAYEEAGETFTGATVAREGTLPEGHSDVSLLAPLTGLSADTAYRFRITASSDQGEAQQQLAFATYRPPDLSAACPNEALRTGTSAALPDCRAYELVTPSNTNGHFFSGTPRYGSTEFASHNVSPNGNAVSFLVEGGGIPGLQGTGGLKGDAYLATRSSDGWHTILAGPHGAQAEDIVPGPFGADQGYSLFDATGGSLAPGSTEVTYLRYPDGRMELLGRGSLGSDEHATGLLISPQARHVIFSSSQELETGAAPAGTETIYDRTIDPATGAEQTHVVSLLPGDVFAVAGQNASFEGASREGQGVAFRIGSTLYLRYQDHTYEVAEGVEFAGVAEGGARVFYLQGGDLWRFEAPGEERTRFTEAGDATLANISADGSTAYFISPSALAVEPGPREAVPTEGEPNLYASVEGAVSFVGTVVEEDLEATAEEGGFFEIGSQEGLGLWTDAVKSGQPTLDASRSSADGAVLSFSSHADLTSYEANGYAQIYRYDLSSNSLACLSCAPTLQAPRHEAKLQTISRGWGQDDFPLTRNDAVENLTSDGGRAFFESTEPLLAADVDGVRDVYEWEEQGLGSCRTAGGCTYLISTGQSAHPNYLYGVSNGGRDVFISTSDLLLPDQDPDETPSLYDARAEGGIAPPPAPAGECLGETCQPAAVPPQRPALASSVFEGAGNIKSGPKKCPKSKRRVKRKGAFRCLTAHKSHHHRKHAAKRRASR
jgi:hypothetical protein